jgi:hypothetical protein
VGDFNVMPTELDVYKPERWVEDALFIPKPAPRFRLCCNKAGLTPFALYILRRKSTPFGITLEMRTRATPAAHRSFPAEP